MERDFAGLRVRDVRHIHLTAVCGSGMGALAGLLKQAGYIVSGSDVSYDPPMGPQLRALNIRLYEGYRASNIGEDVDLAVIGNAVSKQNEEALAILERKIPYISFAEALNRFFLTGSFNLVIAGTHGKTTTSSILSWILEVAGLDPGFMIGGIPGNFGVNFKLGSGRYMVLEGDEYNTAFFDKRPKFVHYNPTGVILTGIEFDHADIYRDKQDVLNAFDMLFPIIPANGYLLFCSDYPDLHKIVGERAYAAEGYGLAPDATWRGILGDVNQEGMTFNILKNGKKEATVFTPMSGNQNLQNIVACIAMARHLDIPWDKIQDACKTFKGVKKRQEIIGSAGDIQVMVDFAHHPTAVTLTLEGLASRFPARRIIAVFEPKTQTSRRNIFQKDYADALNHAHLVVLAPVYNPYNLPESELLSLDTIITTLKSYNKTAFKSTNYDELADILLDVSREGDLVVFMSSGDFEGVPGRFLKQLQSRSGEC